MSKTTRAFLFSIVILTVCVALAYFFILLNTTAVHIVSFTGLFRIIEQFIIPLEIQATLIMMGLLHIQATGSQSIISTVNNGTLQDFVITWNCTGWQSLLMLMISFIALIQYKGMVYKKSFIIFTGIVWIFLANIGRITLEIVTYHKAGLQPALFFHDYLAKAYILLMFSLFWILTYSFVLKCKKEKTILLKS